MNKINKIHSDLETVDIFQLLPSDVSMTDHCSPLFYQRWEDKIATPALQALGYTVGRWQTGEHDSFGPLSRWVLVEKDGIKSTVIYG